MEFGPRRFELRYFDPFLVLDEFSGELPSIRPLPSLFLNHRSSTSDAPLGADETKLTGSLPEFRAVSAPAGFPDHPHRGFETVTYMLEVCSNSTPKAIIFLGFDPSHPIPSPLRYDNQPCVCGAVSHQHQNQKHRDISVSSAALDQCQVSSPALEESVCPDGARLVSVASPGSLGRACVPPESRQPTTLRCGLYFSELKGSTPHQKVITQRRKARLIIPCMTPINS